jgi:hypothetical protein
MIEEERDADWAAMSASILKKEPTPAWKKEPSPARYTQMGAAWYSQITGGITKGFGTFFESTVQKTVEQTMDARNPPSNSRQVDGDNEREAETTL